MNPIGLPMASGAIPLVSNIPWAGKVPDGMATTTATAIGDVPIAGAKSYATFDPRYPMPKLAPVSPGKRKKKTNTKVVAATGPVIHELDDD